MTRNRYWPMLIVATVVLAPSLSLALNMHRAEGAWPDSWPKELDAYRKQARTVGVAHGIQENNYEIPFADREEFEKAWPLILKVKDPGAPIILMTPPGYYGTSGSTMTVGVRILAPAHDSRIPDHPLGNIGGKEWLEAVKTPEGDIPEYVVTSGTKWMAYDGENRTSFIYRARTDIQLVVDGKTVDLNRILFPPNTPIVDKRKLK